MRKAVVEIDEWGNETLVFRDYADIWRERMDERVAMLNDGRGHLLGDVYEQFGSWCVTSAGVEALATEYIIENDVVHQPHWAIHMAGYAWVEMHDFLTALKFAREIVPYPVPPPALAGKPQREKIMPKLRFTILRRDNYRCGLCGREAQEGVKLQIDHMVPVSKGGKSDPENLWTLCAECNAGKRDSLG